MKPQQNVSLANYSTMGLGGLAAYLAEVHSLEELGQVLAWAKPQKLPVIMVGKGSNIVWRDEGFPGLVLINDIRKFESQESADGVILTIGGGENWDVVVERSVKDGLTGIEALSLIPGTAGATPVQNVGAYGQEISDTLISVEAYDIKTGDFVTIANADCDFGYRTSRFKTTDRGRFYITSLRLQLKQGNPKPPFYAAVQDYFNEHNINEYTPLTLREAVVDIRTKKLPDPVVIHNTGSFFKNPIINKALLNKLHDSHPNVPYWETQNTEQVKVSAAWLLEQAGFKGVYDKQTGMATQSNQPLVLVNKHAKSTADLLAFKQKIVGAVQAKFGITLEQEPELLP